MSKLLTSAVGIKKHITVNKQNYFLLQWESGTSDSEIMNCFYSWNCLEKSNPQLLLSYLKQFITVNN